MSTTDRLHLVVPEAAADVRHPSGGNVYDLELERALARQRLDVVRHLVPGGFPGSHPSPRDALGDVLSALPTGAVALVDGLLVSDRAQLLAGLRGRLAVLVLVHLPKGLADASALARERRALGAAAGVVTTSGWTRRWLCESYQLPWDRVWLARPGVAPAPFTSPTAPGTRLLCVGPVTRLKGQDLLVEALGRVRDLPWSCRLVGPLDRDADAVWRVRRRAAGLGIADRVVLEGGVPHERMTTVYRDVDLLVVPSRIETYGMVVGEALARGIPVLAADSGGVPEALGRTTPGDLPGILVPAGSADALAAALRRWLVDPVLRADLRAAAVVRRGELAGWDSTAARVRGVLGSGAVRASDHEVASPRARPTAGAVR